MTRTTEEILEDSEEVGKQYRASKRYTVSLLSKEERSVYMLKLKEACDDRAVLIAEMAVKLRESEERVAALDTIIIKLQCTNIPHPSRRNDR